VICTCVTPSGEVSDVEVAPAWASGVLRRRRGCRQAVARERAGSESAEMPRTLRWPSAMACAGSVSCRLEG